MPDLGILEILIAFLLFLPLTRPYIKNFARVEGFVFLPPLALFCVIGIFPSYGFRPEALPLLIYTIVSNILNYEGLRAKLQRLNYSDFIAPNPVSFFISTLCLVLVMLPALRFLPLSDPRVSAEASLFYAYDTTNDNGYYIRLYKDDEPALYNSPAGGTDGAEDAGGDDGANDGENDAEEAGDIDGADNEDGAEDGGGAQIEKALLLVAPPVMGGASIVDEVCSAFSKEGFDVLNFSRSGLDFPAKGIGDAVYYPEYEVLKKYLRSVTGKAWKNEAANKAAVFFEDERLKDIVFMLSYIKEHFDYNKIYLLAYNESASAALDFALFKEPPDNLRVAAVDARLYSAFLHKTETATAAETWENKNAFYDFISKRIDDIENIFFSKDKSDFNAIKKIPSPRVPVILLNSSRTRDDIFSKSEYAAVFELVKSNSENLKLITLPDGASLFLTDIPEKYPVISELFASEKSGGAGELFSVLRTFWEE